MQELDNPVEWMVLNLIYSEDYPKPKQEVGAAFTL